MCASVRQLCVLRAGDAAQLVRRKLRLRADFAGGDADRVKELGGFVDERGKQLLHADGAAPAVHVAGGREKELLRDHLHGLFAAGLRGALEAERRVHRNDEDEKLAAFALGDERLEDGLRVLPELPGDGHDVDAQIGIIDMHGMGNALPFEDAHRVGLDGFCHGNPFLSNYTTL